MTNTTNCKCWIIVIIVFGNTHTSEDFFRSTVSPLLHLAIQSYQDILTVTSIASPDRKLSKSIFCLADSAASIDNCLIREFALRITLLTEKSPFVRFLQFDVVRIRLDVEWKRANIIWRPFLLLWWNRRYFTREIRQECSRSCATHSPW